MFDEEIVCENYFELLGSVLRELCDCSDDSDVALVQDGSILK